MYVFVFPFDKSQIICRNDRRMLSPCENKTFQLDIAGKAIITLDHQPQFFSSLEIYFLQFTYLGHVVSPQMLAVQSPSLFFPLDKEVEGIPNENLSF